MSDYKFNIFELLERLDKKDIEYILRLTDDELKEIQPYVLMRWMSATKDKNMHLYHSAVVNELVNKNFNVLSKHKKLQLLLLACSGIGIKQFHQWVKPPKKKSSSKIDQHLKDIFGILNNDELNIIKSQFDNKSFENFLKEQGYQDKKVKEILKEWKK